MSSKNPLALIEHKLNDSLVEQRSIDGYINATELCKAANKLFADYNRLGTTKDFLNELSADMGIPISDLIQTVKGGNANQGTWIHPQVAAHLALWLSAKFAVQVSKWIATWMSSGSHYAPMAHHLTRYVNNDSKIPPGYFSILQETTLALTAPLHNMGFIIPKGWVPDISVGRLFCKWLRDTKGVDTDAFETYMHSYGDARGTQPAKLYPDDHLADCRHWFRIVWLPVHGVKYFRKKDPSCLQYIQQLPSIAANSSKYDEDEEEES